MSDLNSFPITVVRIPDLPLDSVPAADDRFPMWKSADDTTNGTKFSDLIAALASKPFAVQGNDTTTIVVAALINKTLLTLTKDGIGQNFDNSVTPLDCTFTSGTGTFVFAGPVSIDSPITGTYR